MTAVGGIYCFRFLRKFSPLTFWGKSSRASIFLFLLGNSLSLIYLPFEVSFSVSLGHRPCSTLSSSQSFIYQSIRCQNVFSWLLYSHLCAPPHSRGKSGYKTCTKSRSHVVSLEEERPWNVTIGFLVIEFLHAYAQKNTIFHVENLVQQSVNATSSPSATRKQLLLVLNCNSHLSCPFV